MKENISKKFPYKSLGSRLKRMREKHRESVAEVSGAVEIDMSMLADIESGIHRPSEDILMLLMNHFAVKDDEAVKLWELAGYNRQDVISDAQDIKQVMVMPMDARIVYTDMAHVMVNKHGVVMNFMQEVGLGGQPLAVARIGMSREHAVSVLGLLQKALQEDRPKFLPAPESKSETDQGKQASG